MAGKIWHFDILVDDCFVNFNPDRAKITPDTNDFLLSIVNGFEDGNWMKKNFQQFIFNNIAQTALTTEERRKCVDSSYTALTESARHLRLIDDKGKGSEIAEIVLYGIMKHHYGAISATPKIFYKQNDNDNAKGADAVHIVLTKDGDFQLWLGEAKFYNSIDDTRFADPLSSVAQMLATPIIRKEVGVMTSLRELDEQIENPELVKKIKNILENGESVDCVKSRIHVPILLLHECSITASCRKMDDSYKEKIINYHKERATSFFEKQIKKLGDLSEYEQINFHLILFPLPNKDKIVNWFMERAKMLKEDADN